MTILPTVRHIESTYNIKIPSTGKEIQFRRMKLSDEKVLLFAKASSDDNEIYTAILQVVQNCLVTPNIVIEELALLDVEFLFLTLRAQSVSNIIKMSFTDTDDNQSYEFDVNIFDIKTPEFKKSNDLRIMFTDEVGVIMRYPTAEIYKDTDFLSNNDSTYEKLVVKCIDKIFNKENTYSHKDVTEEELINWINDLEVQDFQKIDSFVSTIPTLKYEIKYKNRNGIDRTITLASLNDFFTLH